MTILSIARNCAETRNKIVIAKNTIKEAMYYLDTALTANEKQIRALELNYDLDFRYTVDGKVYDVKSPDVKSENRLDDDGFIEIDGFEEI